MKDVKNDFDLYTRYFLQWYGMIHDTDESYEKDYIVTDDIEKDFDDVTNGLKISKRT